MSWNQLIDNAESNFVNSCCSSRNILSLSLIISFFRMRRGFTWMDLWIRRTIDLEFHKSAYFSLYGIALQKDRCLLRYVEKKDWRSIFFEVPVTSDQIIIENFVASMEQSEFYAWFR